MAPHTSSDVERQCCKDSQAEMYATCNFVPLQCVANFVLDDDRFEPYVPSAKRRAVSPSITYLKERELLVSPIVIPRSPVLRPRRSFSQSQANSATSSPTIAYGSSAHLYGNGNSFNGSFSLPHNGNGHHRSGSTSSAVSSPTVRASMMLASPILRPTARLAGAFRRAGEEEKVVDGAGEDLKDLNIGR